MSQYTVPDLFFPLGFFLPHKRRIPAWERMDASPGAPRGRRPSIVHTANALHAVSLEHARLRETGSRRAPAVPHWVLHAVLERLVEMGTAHLVVAQRVEHARDALLTEKSPRGREVAVCVVDASVIAWIGGYSVGGFRFAWPLETRPPESVVMVSDVTAWCAETDDRPPKIGLQRARSLFNALCDWLGITGEHGPGAP